MIIGGVEYVTTSQVCERLAPDVTAAVVHKWVSRRLLAPLVDPAGARVLLDGQLVFAWAEVVEIEHRTRTAARGRRRAGLGVPLAPGT